MLPNLFLVGAARAGTTSLWKYLSAHPQVHFPLLKEPKYFSVEDNRFPHNGPGDAAVDALVVRTWSEYQRLFQPDARVTVAGDASVDSLYFAGAARRIAERCPGATILIVLRDPVDRAFSAYKYLVLSGRESLSFEEALEREPDRRRRNWEFIWHYRRASEYAAQVDRYVRMFGRARVHTVLFDDLVRRPREVLAPLFAALGLPVMPPRIEFDHLERSAIPRNRLLRALVVRRSRLHGAARSLLPGTVARLQTTVQRWSREALVLSPGTRLALGRAFAADRRDLEDVLGRPVRWRSNA